MTDLPTLDAALLRPVGSKQPYPLVCATVSGVRSWDRSRLPAEPTAQVALLELVVRTRPGA